MINELTSRYAINCVFENLGKTPVVDDRCFCLFGMFAAITLDQGAVFRILFP